MGRSLTVELTDLEVAVLSLQDEAPVARLEAIWQGFEAASGSKLARPPTAEERELVSEWMRLRRTEQDELFAVRSHRVRTLVHRTPSEKAGLLAQGGCDACELVVDADGRPTLAMHAAINVEPWSAQSETNRVAIREAVRDAMVEKGWHSPVRTEAVCLRITSFVPRGRGRMDVDNLVKGLTDSLQGVLYVNDWQVQCLTSRRLMTSATQGAYSLAAQVVHAFEEDVVHDDGRPLNIPSPRLGPR